MGMANDGISARTTNGKRSSNFGKLTNPEIKQAKPKEKSYRIPDGGNLYLEISPNGAKRWFLKYFFSGKENRLALGVFPAVTLALARERARNAKSQLAEGIDPNDAKRQVKLARVIAAGNSFEVVSAEWYAKQSPHWSATHKTRTVGILKNNLSQWIGQRPIGEITAPELLAALRKTENKGTLETAKRALQIAGQVFRYGVQTGRAERDPSQGLKGALATPKSTHFAAITEPAALGKLLLAIDGYSGTPEVRSPPFQEFMIDRDVKLLNLSKSDCEKILQTDGYHQNNFTSGYIFEKNTELVRVDTDTFLHGKYRRLIYRKTPLPVTSVDIAETVRSGEPVFVLRRSNTISSARNSDNESIGKPFLACHK